MSKIKFTKTDNNEIMVEREGDGWLSRSYGGIAYIVLHDEQWQLQLNTDEQDLFIKGDELRIVLEKIDWLNKNC